MRIAFMLSAGAAAAVVAACSSTGQPAAGPAGVAASGRQCIYTPNITGFRRGPNDTVIINTNARDYYEFKTQAYCADRLNWENAIALRSRTGAFVCSGYDAEIYIPDAVGAAYCPVYDMRKLSPAEVAAVRATRL